MNEVAGKPARVRKIEFLIKNYTDSQKKEDFGSERYYHLERVINSLRNDYLVETGRVYRYIDDIISQLPLSCDNRASSSPSQLS